MNRFQIRRLDSRKWAPIRRGLVVGAWLLATVVTPRLVVAVPLGDLLAGASISVGDCWFTDWQLVSLDATSTVPNLSLVSVNPLTNDLGAPGVQFVGNGQLAVSGAHGLDLVLKYRVQALPAGNTFEGHALTIASLTFTTNSGVGFVSDGLVTAPGVNLESAVAIGDPANAVFQYADVSTFSPQSGVFVTTNIFLQGLFAGDAVNLTSFSQRFLQTGPPVLEGDYSDNGVVDAADYSVWRDALGSPAGTLPNDTSGLAVGASQYNAWKANFGNTSGTGAFANFAVPEPTALLLTIAGTAPAVVRRRQRTMRLT